MALLSIMLRNDHDGVHVNIVAWALMPLADDKVRWTRTFRLDQFTAESPASDVLVGLSERLLELLQSPDAY